MTIFHIHPVYDAFCGSTTGVFTTDDRNVNCEVCKNNIMEQLPMDIDNYLSHYSKFHAEFFPEAGYIEKRRKFRHEIEEFMAAYNYGTEDEELDEAIDVMNTAIAYLVARGIKNPLYEGYRKLERTRAKYLAQRGEPPCVQSKQ